VRARQVPDRRWDNSWPSREVYAQAPTRWHQTWPILQQHGVTEDSVPQLDCLYRHQVDVKWARFYTANGL
jgi:hypothetical protein